MLTNFNIFFLYKRGVFNNVDDTIKIPLNQIKIINGQAQALLSNENVSAQLQLCLKNGQEKFSFPFNSKKEVMKWINNINLILTGNTAQINDNKNIMAIPGTEQLAETFKDTVGAFKSALGIKTKEENSSNTTAKCIGCMAPISGIKGQTVRCKYCDTKQTL